MSQVPRILSPVDTLSVPLSGNNSTNSSRDSSPVRRSSRAASNNHQTSAARSHRQPKSANTSSGRATSTSRSERQSPSHQQQQQLDKPDLSSHPPSVETSDADADLPTMPPPPRRKGSVPSSLSRDGTSKTTTNGRFENQANTSSKRASLTPSPEEEVVSPTARTAAEAGSRSRRNSTRTTGGTGTPLETVEESSAPSTPLDKVTTGENKLEESHLQRIDEAVRQAVESGSDSGGNKSSGSGEDKRKLPVSRPPGNVLPKRSMTSLNSARAKPGDAPVSNMIVETETVTSIPQVSLGVGAGERGSARNEQGALRPKPSAETIRPRKEKKRTTRKPPVSGNSSSKADIFEAKVASAVDEADVSDSDETFVYESNPPDAQAGRIRYHSRTPSATSMASQADQYASRSRLGRDGMSGKRSMKFTNNYNHSGLDGDMGDSDHRGRGGRFDGNGHTGRHHHIGRYGRGGGPPFQFDNDSPFSKSQPQPPRSPRHFIGGGWRHSRRSRHANYQTISGSKGIGDTSMEDLDGDGADDERAPLVGSARTPRNRYSRRPGSASMRQMEFYDQRRRGCLSRSGGCIIVVFLALMLVGGAVTLLTAMTRPLQNVRVVNITNVLASEQEIMLDLNVMATNPNLLPISVSALDVNVFARSRYVGSEKFWRIHGPHPGETFPRAERSKQRAELSRLARRADDVHTAEGVDRGTDPIEQDPSGDPQTMLLGRVFQFDSPVTFDPTPWRHDPSITTGQIRLTKPGNRTEEGGTARWERVLQHPFQLIVRGVLQYSLPLGSSDRSASISSKVQVFSDEDQDQPPPEEEHPGNDNDTVHITTSSSSSSSASPVLIARLFSS